MPELILCQRFQQDHGSEDSRNNPLILRMRGNRRIAFGALTRFAQARANAPQHEERFGQTSQTGLLGV